MFNVYCFPMPSINMKKNWSLFIRWWGGTIEILPLGGFDLCKCTGRKPTLLPQNMASLAPKNSLKTLCTISTIVLFFCLV
jgi:hypothetical protein